MVSVSPYFVNTIPVIVSNTSRSLNLWIDFHATFVHIFRAAERRIPQPSTPYDKYVIRRKQAKLSSSPGAIVLSKEDSCDECQAGGYQCIILSHSTRGERRCEGCNALACSFLRTDRPFRGTSLLANLQVTASLLLDHPDLDPEHRSAVASIQHNLSKLGESRDGASLTGDEGGPEAQEKSSDDHEGSGS
jgi:hypothetical protein